MYSKITNPRTGEKILITSEKGKSILRKYIISLTGGGGDIYYKEIARNIYFLILNREKKVYIKSLSWCQKFYLDKLELYFPGIVKKCLVKKSDVVGAFYKSKISLKPLLPNKTDLINTKKTSRDIISPYADYIVSISDNKCLEKETSKKDSFGLISNNSITWAVQRWFGDSDFGRQKTHYPQSNLKKVEQNINKLEDYMDTKAQNKKFKASNPIFHLIWRNRLIPAHEIVHFTQGVHNGKSFYYFGNDDHSQCFPVSNKDSRIKNIKEENWELEWLASAPNLNIFIGSKKLKFNIEKNQLEKRLHQLRAIEGVLYCVYLINCFYECIKNGDRFIHNARDSIDIIDKWTSLNLTKKDYTKINNILSLQDSPWKNTYSKHIIALYYCYEFFNPIKVSNEDINSEEFTNKCLDFSILSKHKLYSENRHILDFWNSAKLPKKCEIIDWLKINI